MVVGGGEINAMMVHVLVRSNAVVEEDATSCVATVIEDAVVDVGKEVIFVIFEKEQIIEQSTAFYNKLSIIIQDTHSPAPVKEDAEVGMGKEVSFVICKRGRGATH